jgi:hypothetical protein
LVLRRDKVFISIKKLRIKTEKKATNEKTAKRDTDFHYTREGIVLARNWLKSDLQNVKQFTIDGKIGYIASIQSNIIHIAKNP